MAFMWKSGVDNKTREFSSIRLDSAWSLGVKQKPTVREQNPLGMPVEPLGVRLDADVAAGRPMIAALGRR